MSKILYINFADDKFAKSQKDLLSRYSSFGFSCHGYSDFDIDKDFYEYNKKILGCSRGHGYWLWKPYFILRTMKQNIGSVILYTDCGDIPRTNPRSFIESKIETSGFFIIENSGINKHWTKRLCFQEMRCDISEYHELRQVEAGICAFLSNDKTIEFVEEWLTNCQNDRAITDECHSIANYDGFIDHRHDQSILTNLVKRHSIPTVHIGQIGQIFAYNQLTG